MTEFELGLLVGAATSWLVSLAYAWRWRRSGTTLRISTVLDVSPGDKVITVRHDR